MKVHLDVVLLLKGHGETIAGRLHLTRSCHFQTALMLRRPGPPSGGPRRHKTQQLRHRRWPLLALLALPSLPIHFHRSGPFTFSV